MRNGSIKENEGGKEGNQAEQQPIKPTIGDQDVGEFIEYEHQKRNTGEAEVIEGRGILSVPF